MFQSLDALVDRMQAKAQQQHQRGMISCPRCAALAVRGTKPGWSYALAVLLTLFIFPFGLFGWLAPLLVPRNPTRCPSCRFMWVV